LVSISLGEFCRIRLNFTADGRLHEFCQEITVIISTCTVIVLIIRDLVLYCVLRCTLEDLLQVDDMLHVVHFLWPHSQSVVKEKKKIILILQRPVRYHPYVKYCKTSLLS